MGKNHQGWEALKPYHHANGKKAPEKGCIWRHKGRQEGHECSHQWQAHKKAKEFDESKLYNWPAYRSITSQPTFESGSRISRKGNRFPPGHDLVQKSPRPFDWDVNRNDNFTDYLKPYWHNAHHLVPNRTLHNIINQRCGSKDPGLAHLIKAGLMKAEYNLNDKENMMILPMGKAVAEALGLPRHLRGHEARDGKKNYFNHPDYNKFVAMMMTPIIDDYKKLAKKARSNKKDHEKPPIKLTKDRLVNISRTVRSMIKTQAKDANGASLDEIFGR